MEHGDLVAIDGKKTDDFISEEVKEIINYNPNWTIKWGNVIFFSVAVLIIAITWFIKYPETIAANTRILSINGPKIVSAAIEGKLDRLNIRNNQEVIKGQQLGYFENDAYFNEVLILKKWVEYNTERLNERKSYFISYSSLPKLYRLGELQTFYQGFQLKVMQSVLKDDLSNTTYESVENQANWSSISNKRKKMISIEAYKEESQQMFLAMLLDLKNCIDNWIHSYVLLAPVSGKITFYSSLKTGDIISKGRELFLIMPLFSQFSGEIKVPLGLIQKFRIGQSLQLKLRKDRENEFERVSGIVEHISPINDNNDTCLVGIKFSNDLLKQNCKNQLFTNNNYMPVQIFLGENRLFNKIIGRQINFVSK